MKRSAALVRSVFNPLECESCRCEFVPASSVLKLATNLLVRVHGNNEGGASLRDETTQEFKWQSPPSRGRPRAARHCLLYLSSRVQTIMRRCLFRRGDPCILYSLPIAVQGKIYRQISMVVCTCKLFRNTERPKRYIQASFKV